MTLSLSIPFAMEKQIGKFTYKFCNVNVMGKTFYRVSYFKLGKCIFNS